MLVKMATISHTWTLLLKVGLVSVSVLCAAVIFNLSLPSLIQFAYTELPSIWTFVMTWLRPPYLYFVINGIIITIVASSKLQQHHHKTAVLDFPPETVAVPSTPAKVSPEYSVVYDGVKDIAAVVEAAPEFAFHDAHGSADADVSPAVETEAETSAVATSRDDEVAISSRSRAGIPKRESTLSLYERPPVSGRIGHRKAVKSVSEGGRALRVSSKPKRQETLETTWKTITEGRSMPLTRHLRKSDTWENTHHPENLDQKLMIKSDTFHGESTRRTSNVSPPVTGKLRKEPSGSWKLRKDPSLGQDELNRRVEAFINKFNEDMRLQRQESLNQYMEMINRGAHHS